MMDRKRFFAGQIARCKNDIESRSCKIEKGAMVRITDVDFSSVDIVDLKDNRKWITDVKSDELEDI